MSTSNSKTRYIYKIAPAAPPPARLDEADTNELEAILPPSELDISSGFIHMSTASQVPGTLEHFFPTSSDERNVIYLLKVPLTSEITGSQNILRWESPDASICGPREGEGLFPHLYFSENEGSEKRLFIRKCEVEVIAEVVSESGTTGWENPLERLNSEQWLI